MFFNSYFSIIYLLTLLVIYLLTYLFQQAHAEIGVTLCKRLVYF